MESSGGKMVRNYKRKTEDRWTKEDLLNALMCIKSNELKINDAARTFGISRATLYRQYAKFIQGGAKCDVNQFRTCGGNPILTKVEEDVLEKTITDLRAQGFTVGSTDIKRICFEYCDSNGIPNQFNSEKRIASDDWYYGFLKRHPSIGTVKSNTNADGTPDDDLLLKPKVKRRPLKPKPKGDNPPNKRSPSNVASPRKKSGKGAKRPRKIKVEQEGETVVFENLEDIAKAEYVLSDNSPNEDEAPEMILGHIGHEDQGNCEETEEVENDDDISEEEHAEENDVEGEEEYESIGMDSEDDQEEADDVVNELPTFEENEIEDEGEESAIEGDDEVEENENGSETGIANEEDCDENEDADDDEDENDDDAEEEGENEVEVAEDVENEDEAAEDVENDDEAAEDIENEDEAAEDIENEDEAAEDIENEDEAVEDVENEDETVEDVENEDDSDGEAENEEEWAGEVEAEEEIENNDDAEEELDGEVDDEADTDDDEGENEEINQLESEADAANETVENGRDNHEDEDELGDPEEEDSRETKRTKQATAKNDTTKKRNRRSLIEKPVDEIIEPKRVTPSRSRKRPARYESLSRSSTPTLPTPKVRSRRSAPIVAEVDDVNGEPRAKRRRSRKNFS